MGNNEKINFPKGIIMPLLLVGLGIFGIIILSPIIWALEHFKVISLVTYLDYSGTVFFGSFLLLIVGGIWIKILEDDEKLKDAYNKGFKDGKETKEAK